jgi:hypothetical protein
MALRAGAKARAGPSPTALMSHLYPDHPARRFHHPRRRHRFCDGPAAPRRGRAQRRRAGAGRAATGFDGPWCVEVNTPEFRALPVEEAAKAAALAVHDDARGAVEQHPDSGIHEVQYATEPVGSPQSPPPTPPRSSRLHPRPSGRQHLPTLPRGRSAPVARRRRAVHPCRRSGGRCSRWAALVAVRAPDLVGVARYEGIRGSRSAGIAVVVDDAL